MVNNDACYIRIRKQTAAPPDSDMAGELAVFAFDFSPWSMALHAPPGYRDRASLRLRGLVSRPQPLGSPTDQADRARIHAQLVQLGLALR